MMNIKIFGINQLVDIIAKISSKSIGKHYNKSGPQGVRGRNSDNTRVQQVLDWYPTVALEDGLRITYSWISNQIKSAGLATTPLTAFQA